MMAQEHGTYVDKYIYRHKPHIEDEKPERKKRNENSLLQKPKDLEREREIEH
jgi:hypothetical protein